MMMPRRVSPVCAVACQRAWVRHDAKKAVEELYSKGVLSYCLTLDANADDYVKRIFGANNYTIIDNVNRLPEKLPTLFASLTA
jgi:nitric oxide reductase activation protein